MAGGLIDKSWLMLRAVMKQDGIDLTSQATIAYGAPPLLARKTISGEMDANLELLEFLRRDEAEDFAAWSAWTTSS